MAFFSTAGAPTSASESLSDQNGTVLPPNFAATLLPPSPSVQDFIVAEISYYQPETGQYNFEVATGAMPTAAVTLEPFQPEQLDRIYMSDLGYISYPPDSIGQKVFDPILVSGWRLDRTARIEPWSNSGSVSWGSLSFIDQNNRYTAVVDNASSDGRSIIIKRGVKRFDKSRGIFIDPPYSELATIFSGVGKGLWLRNQNTVDLEIRDASYQGENPIQRATYGGTGGYDGSAAIKGRPLPFCRGGTLANPIRNVAPILIDATNNIWQYNDAPGRIVNLYERGATVFTNAGDTADLYSGSVASGAYRTDNSRGLFQLGDDSVGEITADVTGDFPIASSQTTAANIARYILTETIGIDPAYIDAGSFIGLNSDRPFVAGVYITDPVDAMSVVDSLLRGLNVWLTPTHSGFLQTVLLRSPNGRTPSATYSTNQIIDCVTRPLPGLLSPPPYRIRVAHTKRYVTQTDNWAGATSEAQKQFVAEPYSYVTWLSASNQNTYRGLNDPPPIETPLLIASEAQEIVDELGALFGVRRAIYEIELPIYLISRHEIGEVIAFSYPGIAQTPINAVVIGDSVDSNSASFTLRVLA